MKVHRIVYLVIAIASSTAFGDTVTKPDPWKTSEYSVVAVEGRFAVYIGTVPVVLDSKLRVKNPKTYLEAIEVFGPAFTSRFSSSGMWEWHFDDRKMYRVHPRWSSGLGDSLVLKLQDTNIQVIDVKRE
jgi:hypothetical protein